ncbi:hypothetical protein ACIQXV_07810 [Neobacillus sp. NPDC097160]|uniref:hypothetical protein n=1 Tax=Neobacillus sp. NPDC097160 TaxID=3364298 RepID=UPI0037F1B752
MAKNVADQKDMEEQLKKEAPFSKKNEHQGDGDQQQDGHRYGDNISEQGDDALQEKYRDGTSMQGDIELQQQEEGAAINHDDELQQKYGHRDEASPSMKDNREFQQRGDMNRNKDQHDEEHESRDNQRQMR